ncbi:MAG TPA: glycosyltransferase [Bryobacteraceae bacterium]|jgi:hypothetical protein|nr:glycosyltransferase [Bryobacteraceae bacterium]
MISKVFHLTAKSKHDLPQSFVKNIDRIKALYPEYEIRIHDDADIQNFLKANYKDYYDNVICQMPKFIMVVDTVRYVWMKHYGGVYCDMDIFFRKRFDFGGGGAVFVKREWTWPKDSSITDSVHNCWFASEAEHPIWDEILDGIAANVRALRGQKERKLASGQLNIFIQKVLGKLRLRERYFPIVFNVTGPNAISKIITQRGLLQKYKDVRVAPASDIFQQGISKGNPSEAFFVHETAGSWAE